jgi:hypothetical protein
MAGRMRFPADGGLPLIGTWVSKMPGNGVIEG